MNKALKVDNKGRIMKMKIIRDKLVEVIPMNKLIIDSDSKLMSDYLIKKVHEELQEIIDSEMKDPYEYGDLLQVIYDLARVSNVSLTKIENARIKKLKERGGFRNGIYLKENT